MNESLTPADVHRLGVELYNAGRTDEAMAYVDENVVDHHRDGDQHGVATWIANRKKWAVDYSDNSVQVEQNVTQGEFSVNRYTVHSTHTASGRKFEVLGMDMIRVHNGKIVEHWALLDHAGLPD